MSAPTAPATKSKPRHARERDRWLCLCGCGVCLRGMRAHARYASDPCKRRDYRRRRQLQASNRAG